ncbi:2825_t:CDS:1, partial [Rhizophagus irregularis]
DIGDKSNEEVFQLQNPKIRRDKGRPASTRKYKASHEKEGNSKT